MDKKTEELILENENNSITSKEYSEDGFWEKVKKFSLVAGKDVLNSTHKCNTS